MTLSCLGKRVDPWIFSGYFSQRIVLIFTMLIFIVLLPYIVVPWILLFLFKRHHVKPLWLAYFYSFVILMFYPVCLEALSDLANIHEEAQGRCAPPIVLINIILIPISFLVQWFFNRRYFE